MFLAATLIKVFKGHVLLAFAFVLIYLALYLRSASKALANETIFSGLNQHSLCLESLQFDIERNRPRELVAKIFKQFPVDPKLAIFDSGDRKFFFSSLYRAENKDLHAVLYVKDKKTKKIYPRLLCRSQNDGDWRVAFTGGEKVARELVEILEQARDFPPGAKQDFAPSFDANRLQSAGYQTFEKEVSFYQDPSLRDLQGRAPGLASKAEWMTLLQKFPDFSKAPSETYHKSHSLLSKADAFGRPLKEIPVEVFLASLRGRAVEWHLAQYGDWAWVDRIRFPGKKLTTYGTDPVVIDSGTLTQIPMKSFLQAIDSQDEGLRANEKLQVLGLFSEDGPREA